MRGDCVHVLKAVSTREFLDARAPKEEKPLAFSALVCTLKRALLPHV